MSKDWTGGKNSIFTTLGASNHCNDERESNDYYATHPDSINHLKRKVDLPRLILEPACGEGHLSERLKEMGHIVKSYDLVDRGYGEQQNFFEMMTAPIDGEFAIVTNPPYKCYDVETECYTKRGWLRYNEVALDDEVMSVNPYTLKLEWSRINAVIVRNIEPTERMFHFKRRHMDIMVTDGHRMFCYNNQNGKLAVDNGDLRKSERIRSTCYIPRKGYKWEGEEQACFVLPGINGMQFAQPCYKEPIRIKMDDWLDFFGLWLADGYCRHTLNQNGNERKTVGIKQLASNGDRIRRALDRLPFKYKEQVDNYEKRHDCINFEIHNEQLWSYLKRFGKAGDKFIPEEIKNLSVRQLELFLQSYHDGDGSVDVGGGVIYRTSSRRLIDDVYEILLKIGYMGHVCHVSYETQDGELRNCYNIRVQPDESKYNKIYFPSNKHARCQVDYNKKVWCLNLERNGVFLVRRNGQEFFCGNCAMEFVQHGLELVPEGSLVCMFLKTTFLEGKRRYNELFKITPPPEWFYSLLNVCCALRMAISRV